MSSVSPTSHGGRPGVTVVDIDVGSRIWLRRNILGLPSTQLADALGITRQQFSNYEHGQDKIGAARLYAVASLLGVAVDFFDGLRDAETTENEY
jgi:transcriptional regulator with XRE-family HTH domain